jgi:hypothetical protein
MHAAPKPTVPHNCILPLFSAASTLKLGEFMRKSSFGSTGGNLALQFVSAS